MAFPAKHEDTDPTSTSDRAAARGTPGGTEDAGPTDPDDMSWANRVQAENSRPTLPDETADGLDDMDEEVRRQAEDRPLDATGDMDDRE